ncbi:unnamed protein product [Sphagnum jensenii]|uniref:Uncharacterized protein n=1 Tax=Sphagnum jensenii TaxID=128206 RepID=A0ABP0WP22_9BRYO
MSTAYGNFIGATMSNRHFQKQGNMSYLLPDSLLHLRTILKDQQQLYHDILHFADNEIQVWHSGILIEGQWSGPSPN